MVKLRGIEDSTLAYEKGNKQVKAIQAQNQSLSLTFKTLFSKQEIAFGDVVRAKVKRVFGSCKIYLDYHKTYIKIEVDKPRTKDLKSDRYEELKNFCELTNIAIHERTSLDEVRSLIFRIEK
jgi:hypothetical protein